MNPSPGNLLRLVGRFDNAWSEELETLLTENDELLKRELAFLLDRRNKIAHGQSESIGTVKALALVPHAKRVAQWFVTTLDPR